MRIDRKSLPDGLYAYDLRDGCDGEICQLKNHIMVNHWGTCILKEPIEGSSEGVDITEDDSLPKRPQPEIHPHTDSEQAVGYAGGERRSGVYGDRSAQGMLFLLTYLFVMGMQLIDSLGTMI